DSGVWHERQSTSARARRAAAALFADEARLQVDEVSRVDELQRRSARWLLGRSGVPMVRRGLTLVVALAALACRENRNMTDRTVMPPADSAMIKNPMKPTACSTRCRAVRWRGGTIARRSG